MALIGLLLLLLVPTALAQRDFRESHLADTHADAEPFWLDIDRNEKISLAPQVVTANGYVFLVLHHYHGRRSQGWFIESFNHEKISASLVQDPGISSVALI